MFCKTIGVVLIASLLFSSCASHIASVSEPSPEASSEQWLLYWQDQFKAYGDSTLAPRDDAPEVGRQAYSEAKAKWKKEQTTKTITSGIILGLASVAVMVVVGVAIGNAVSP